jgi:FKBP-type peptidyl-prolyl cis-trans isomerase
MKSSLKTKFLLSIISLMSIFTACEPYPGYEKISDDVWMKLESFGECEPDLINAKHFLMEVKFNHHQNNDTGYQFLLHHHALHAEQPTTYKGDLLGLRLSAILDSLHCGDRVSLILPFSEFDNSWLAAFADSSMYSAEDLMHLNLHLIKTFDATGYRKYLMQAAQQGELSEAEAIELLLMNDVERSYEKHGQCFIQYTADQQGDSITVGREISIRYNTFLLDGTRLDDTTSLQFNFGKPGQIIGGLQYALSFMQEGDEAIVYLPSVIAFGQQGSTGNVVPPSTPVYFSIKVESVLKPE